MLTSGFLAALAEILAGRFAGVQPTAAKNVDGSESILNTFKGIGIDERAIKMAVYGALISAPLGHVMTGELGRQ